MIWYRKRLFCRVVWRPKHERQNWWPSYGIGFDVKLGAVKTINAHIHFHKYALFIAVGIKYKGEVVNGSV